MREISKSDVTRRLENTIIRATTKMCVYGCLEVTIGVNGRERVDYMTVDTKGIWRCYEIKSSLSDFRSKAKKTFVGNYNYYVLTSELYEKVKDEIPSHIGVYTHHICVKKPKKQELQVERDVLMMSMIRSLARDAMKYYEVENEITVDYYKRQISYLKNEKRLKEHRIFELEAELRETKR